MRFLKFKAILPPPIFLVIPLLFSLLFIQCSKGSGIIAPIMPDGEYIPEPASEDTLFIDPSENNRQGESSFHPQISPIMAEDDFFELDNKLVSEIGDIELPAGEIRLLFCDPQGVAKTNPPLLRFGFVTPIGAFNPDDAVVTLDSENISGRVRYSKYYHPGRKADYYLATYMPDMYVNPLIQHSFDVQITPQEGLLLQKQVGFDVQSDDNLRVIAATFDVDSEKGIVKLDKLMVLITYPSVIKMGDRLLDPSRWSIDYADSGLSPAISSIDRIHDKVYAISFSSEFTIAKPVDLFFKPADGVKSETYKFVVPERTVERGGGVVRKMASDLTECTVCQLDSQGDESKLTLQEAHSAIDCETQHSVRVSANCPPHNCSPGIRDFTSTTTYEFSNDYINLDEETGDRIYFPSASTFALTNVGTCNSFTRPYDANTDVKAFYEMVALEDPIHGYCLVDELTGVEVKSDTVLPVIDAGPHFTIERRCAEAPCTDCEAYANYILTVKATDNNCVNQYPMFLIKLNDGTWFEATAVYSNSFIPPGIVENHVFEKRYLVYPNAFACVDLLKIIVHDQKGNWSSHRIEKMDNSPVYNPDRLPYPSKLILEYDDNLPVGNDQKQYVNLNRAFESEIDQDVCAVRLIKDTQNDLDVNHGGLIYMQVTAYPPLPGINIKVEYTDPEADFTGKQSPAPTNTRDGQPGSDKCIVFTPGSDKTFSESENGSLDEFGYHKLWSQHDPYGNDGRTLGDNWNYYLKAGDSIQNYSVPWCDPILSDYQPKNPCFWNCVAPPGQFCLDLNCYKGETIISTNIYGKRGLYFDTMSHGGDNFQFRADCPLTPPFENCLIPAEPAEKFTVWRKIYLDFAYMEDRGINYPDPPCYAETLEESAVYEYNGIHKLDDGEGTAFNYIKGAFDDAYIEIEKADGPYQSWLPYEPYLNTNLLWGDLVDYGDYSNFRPNPPLDTILLIGVDHFDKKCHDPTPPAYFKNGASLQHWGINPEDALYCYVGIGVTYDALATGKEVKTKENEDNTPYWKIIGYSSAHELGHSLLQQGDLAHYAPYGVMNYDDRRSYFYDSHLKYLRAGTTKFDLEIY